jgi:hypothetical protein
MFPIQISRNLLTMTHMLSNSTAGIHGVGLVSDIARLLPSLPPFMFPRVAFGPVTVRIGNVCICYVGMGPVCMVDCSTFVLGAHMKSISCSFSIQLKQCASRANPSADRESF